MAGNTHRTSSGVSVVEHVDGSVTLSSCSGIVHLTNTQWRETIMYGFAVNTTKEYIHGCLTGPEAEGEAA